MSAQDMDSSSSTPEKSASILDWIRWLGALAGVAGAAILVVGSQYSSKLQVCEIATAQASLEVCKPFPIEATLPLFVLALALMWKDVSEFSITGLGRVVRRIDEKQERLQEGQATLQGQLSVIQSQTLTNNIYFNEGLREESEAVLRRDPELASEVESSPSVWSDLEQAWEVLRPWSQLAVRVRDPYFREVLATSSPGEWEKKLSSADRALLSSSQLDPADVGKFQAWASSAHRRLELVRKAVRVGPDLPEPQVEQALVVARGLLDELEKEGLAQRS